MSQDARISSRIDADLKEKGEAVLDELGVKPSQVISMLYRQIVRTRRLPFDPTLDGSTSQDDPKTDISKYLGIAQGTFGSADEIDEYVRNERSSWGS